MCDGVCVPSLQLSCEAQETKMAHLTEPNHLNKSDYLFFHHAE